MNVWMTPVHHDRDEDELPLAQFVNSGSYLCTKDRPNDAPEFISSKT